jgi:hypothetical protein
MHEKIILKQFMAAKNDRSVLNDVQRAIGLQDTQSLAGAIAVSETSVSIK